MKPHPADFVRENTLPNPPRSWVMWDFKEEEDGNRHAKFSLEGYIVALDSGIEYMGFNNHVFISDEFIKIGQVTFDELPPGVDGVIGQITPWPQGRYVKLFHISQAFAGELDLIRSCAGKPVKLRIEGTAYFRNLKASDVDDESREVLKKYCFERFDRSNKCPLISLSKVEIIGKLMTWGGGFKIPFTRIHLNPCLGVYIQPAAELTTPAASAPMRRPQVI